MSRYVKADMIGCPCGYCEGYYECQKEVDEAPSIDIVRCQECKYTEFCEKKIHRHGITYSIDFCSYGVRNCSEKPNNSTIEDCSDVGKE